VIAVSVESSLADISDAQASSAEPAPAAKQKSYRRPSSSARRR
jgi:hypothetical protein